MELNQIVLAIVQGITELLPISSSGHLIIFGEILEIKYSLAFLTLLHIATLGGIVIGYWAEIVEIVRSNARGRILQNVIISSFPAVLIGVLAGDLLDRYFYNIPFIVFTLVIWGIAMIVTELWHDAQTANTKSNVDEMDWKDALFIGLLQPLALLPGTSRSGITTIAGIWRGIRKDIALEYSFIAGIPLIAGAFLYEVASDTDSFRPFANLNGIIIVTTAFVVSVTAVLILKKVSKRKFLTFFGWYRIGLGLLLMLYLLFS